MNEKEKKICSYCAREKFSEFCEFCGEKTPSNLSVEIFEKNRLRGIFKIKFKRSGRGVRSIIRSGWKSSRDSKFKNGVYEDGIINKDKNQYHQVVRDAKSGKVIHEEHEPLTRHKPIKK